MADNVERTPGLGSASSPRMSYGVAHAFQMVVASSKARLPNVG